MHENHFGLREGCGGTIRVFVRVDEQRGLSFEMTVFATDASVDVDVPDGIDSSALREHAAGEDTALEALHWLSLQEEVAITEGAVSRNNLFAGTTSGSDGFALDADFVQVLLMTDSAHDVSVLEGYSADNAVSYARPRLEPQGIQHFWEYGCGTAFSILARPFSALLTRLQTSC